MDSVGQAVLWFMQLHYGSASSLEVIWTVASAVGLVLAVWLLREALRDRVVLVHAIDYIPAGPRDIIAQENVRTSVYRVVLEFFFTFLGAVALLSATPYRTPSTYAILLSLGTTSMAVMLAVGAVQDRRDRQEFLRQIRLLGARRDRRTTDPAPYCPKDKEAHP